MMTTRLELGRAMYQNGRIVAKGETIELARFEETDAKAQTFLGTIGVDFERVQHANGAKENVQVVFDVSDIKALQTRTGNTEQRKIRKIQIDHDGNGAQTVGRQSGEDKGYALFISSDRDAVLEQAKVIKKQ